MSKSIFSYFKKSNDNNASSNIPALSAVSGVSQEELSMIVEEIGEAAQVNPQARKRVTYKDSDKVRIAKYANLYSVSRAVKHFIGEFPNLRESTIRPWLTSYRDQLKQKIDVGPSTVALLVSQLERNVDVHQFCQMS